MRWVKMWRRRLRALLQREQVERELSEELAFHLEMETAKYVRLGLSPAEARRQAAIAFGAVEKHREEVRDERWLGRLTSLSPDVKLALRMLRKNPALSIVGGLGMAVGIAIAVGFFTFMAAFYYSSPPIPDGERIVALSHMNVLNNDDDGLATPFDYLVWREEVRSIEDIAAAILNSGLRLEGEESRPTPNPAIARMTASGFELSRVPPLLGRPILPADEVPGAPPVVVLGYDEWMRDFSGDPAVIGRTLRISGFAHTIVGVMPQGYRFPSNHGYWLPLTMDAASAQPGEGPQLLVFGRLAPGASERSAEAELAMIGGRLAAEYPEAYETLRPIVRPIVHAILDVQQYPDWSIWLMQFFACALLAAVALNVAVLAYARTAARMGELTVRTALGAHRRRIVTQLFLEALVLAGAAAGLGLLIAQLAYRQLRSLPDSDFIPYWISSDLPLSAIAYAAGLAVLAAFLVGVLTALQATGRNLQANLRELGGTTGMRMGRTWTMLIVVQVTGAVAVLPMIVAIAYNELFARPVPTFPIDGLLALSVAAPVATMSPDDPTSRLGAGEGQRAFETAREELVRRLAREPGVAGVTISSVRPGAGASTRVLVDGSAAVDPPLAVVSTVDPLYFNVFQVPLLAGRFFQPGDQREGASAVIVNRAFVSRILGNEQALGRRFRLPGVAPEAGPPDGPMYEIVGIVEDMFVREKRPDATTPAVYRPHRPGLPVGMITVRARGTAEEVAPRVREIAQEVLPPGSGVTISPMASAYYGAPQKEERGLLVSIISLITLSVLFLAAAGISALMSFAVTQRQREIGIRTALGAPRGRIIASIFSRASRQVGTGLVVGAVLARGLDWLSGGELLEGSAGVILPLVALMMLTAGLVASLGPARRALRIQPIDALRQE